VSVALPSSIVGFAKCDAFSNFFIPWILLLKPILLISIIGLTDGVDGPGAEEKYLYCGVFIHSTLSVL
jgi:hypothetical protein